MVLTVLTDDQIKTILADLTADEFDGFRKVISTALHEYSTNTHNIEDGTYHQPERVSTENLKTGATTLYMPSVGPQGMGCKGKPLDLPPQHPLRILKSLINSP